MKMKDEKRSHNTSRLIYADNRMKNYASPAGQVNHKNFHLNQTVGKSDGNWSQQRTWVILLDTILLLLDSYR